MGVTGWAIVVPIALSLIFMFFGKEYTAIFVIIASSAWITFGFDDKENRYGTPPPETQEKKILTIDRQET